MKIGINIINHAVQNTIVHYIAFIFCLRSLLESDITGYDWQMVVVENGSTSEYTRKLATLLEVIPHIEVIHLSENVGIPKARNISSRKLMEYGCDYTVEVHTDHIFPSVWFKPLVDYLEEHPGVGLCGPGNILTATWPGLPHLGNPYEAVYMPIYAENPTGAKAELFSIKTYDEVKQTIEALSTASKKDLVMEGLLHPAVKRVKMLEEIGLYEENMPVNQCFEDTEEYLRAEQAGWKFMINWNSVVYHYGAFSRVLTAAMYEPLNEWSERVTRNMEFCQEKHGIEVWDTWHKRFEKLSEDIHKLEGNS